MTDEESTQRNVEDIVLYHGSLDELNRAPDTDRQYSLTDRLEWQHHDYVDKSAHIDVFLFEVRRLLLTAGYDGLVNRRLSHSKWTHGSGGASNETSLLIEGTPIVRDAKVKE